MPITPQQALQRTIEQREIFHDEMLHPMRLIMRGEISLKHHGPRWADFGTVVLGDDLYCHEPFCRALCAQGLDFVLVCKPESHRTTYEWLQMLQHSGGCAQHGRSPQHRH